MPTYRGCGMAPNGCGKRNLLLPVDGAVFVEGPLGELTPQRWHCYMCYVMPVLFRHPGKCGCPLGSKTEATCDLVANHPSWVPCRSSSGEKKEANATRGGAPPSKVHMEVSRKKTRQGPLYVPHNRRV